MRHFGTFFALALASGAAAAADKEGNYAVWGVGAKSCNMYVQAVAAGDAGDFKAYAMGYLTAYNTFVPDTFNLSGKLDLTGIMAMVEDYCTRVKMDSFERALKLTAEELAPERQTRPPRNSSQPGW